MQTTNIKRGFNKIAKLWELLEEINSSYSSQVCFICGGYARYCASPCSNPVEVTDVDVYCHNEDAFNDFKKTLLVILEIRNENPNAITFKINPEFCELPIQLIKPQIVGAIVTKGRPIDVLSNFDFSVVRAAFVSPTVALVDDDFLEDEEKKILRIKNIHCPISSMYRCIKYCKKGYWLKTGEMLKLFIDWQERDDSYRTTIINYIERASKEKELTQEEINELYKLLRID